VSTESEIKLARYKQVEKEADEFGRVIGVRRLRPSEQTRLQGMVSDVTGHDKILTDDGEEVEIPHRVPIMLAAAVCMINDVHIAFPKNRAELDAIFDRLDTEGVTAAGKAMVRLNKTDDDAISSKDEAKNLQGTPTFDSFAGS
jgi:hypothetical protein